MYFENLLKPTVALSINKKHVRVITCVYASGTVTQVYIANQLKMDKGDVSKTITDLEKFGWLVRSRMESHNEIKINESRLTEINAFLHSLELFQQSVLVRPHHITISGKFRSRATGLKHRVDLSKSPKIQREGRQVTFQTQYGSIVLYGESNTIKFLVDDFIIPVNKDNIDLFSDYIQSGINYRINMMINFLESQKKISSLGISNVTVFNDDVHIGIATKKDVAKVLDISDTLKDVGLKKDHSLGKENDEWEVHGTLLHASELIKKGAIIFLESKGLYSDPESECEDNFIGFYEWSDGMFRKVK